ncbi:glutamate-5-semialdehyde dehydrogenase [Sphingomonas piscis]|nr:glutamate-5-semialdehyde dehydrogenase [Sphingomonas piscis]
MGEQLLQLGQQAREAANQLRILSADTRSEGIRAMARKVRDSVAEIVTANEEDMGAATQNLDRLMLNEARVFAIADALDEVAALPDPVGAEMSRWQRPNGLDIARVRTPIGVIGMIYESRPNVTADAAAICIRSGNAVILRSGSDALNSSLAIHRALQAGLAEAGLPIHAVQLVDTPDRAAVSALLGGLNGSVDLVIPRGGKGLVQRVQDDAKVPVLSHLEGVCHTYVHKAADPEKAVSIVRNAKMRRVGICGATECLLIDVDIAPSLLPGIAAALEGCELRGDDRARAIVGMNSATEEDWGKEYLAPILAIRVVDGLEQAIDHIATYGTAHTEAIITEDAATAETFLNEVDSAIVIWNASTQFADGGEFGFGAEIGIATGKMHARGPVGPEQLTSFHYLVRGDGQVRP